MTSKSLVAVALAVVVSVVGANIPAACGQEAPPTIAKRIGTVKAINGSSLTLAPA